MNATENQDLRQFNRNYARNSGLIAAMAVAIMLFLSISTSNFSLLRNSLVTALAFACLSLGLRALRFRKAIGDLRNNGSVLIKTRTVQERRGLGNATNRLKMAGLVVLCLLPIISIRVIDPAVWLSLLFGYTVGLNAAELLFYSFIRNHKRSLSNRTFLFAVEDQTPQERLGDH